MTANMSSPPTRRCSPITARARALAETRGVAAAVRSSRSRRHPHRQGAARKPDRLRRRRGARHPQRHLQLHSDPDGSDRRRLSPKCSPTRSGWAMPRPTRASTSAAAIPLISSHCSRAWPSASRRRFRRRPRRGHRAYHAGDIAFAREFGFRIKLLGMARRTDDGHRPAGRIPPWCRWRTPLADVDGALQCRGGRCGEPAAFFFEGRGPAQAPTASAVVADIVDIARGNRRLGFSAGRRTAGRRPRPRRTPRAGAFYLRFDGGRPAGRPGRNRRHAGPAGVSIESMIQRGRRTGRTGLDRHDYPRIAVAGRATCALKAIAASDKVLEPPANDSHGSRI